MFVLQALMMLSSIAGIPDSDSGLRCSVVALGDFDGDGTPDFVIARRGTGPRGFLQSPLPQDGGPGGPGI